MTENIQKFLKHYFFIFLGIGYFILYYKYEHTVIEYIKEASFYSIVAFSYLNALISAFMVYSVITIFERGVEKFFHYIFSYLNNQTHEIIAKEFFIQFTDIFKFYGTIYIFFRFVHLPDNGQVIVDKVASICLTIICIFFITTLIKIIFEKGVFSHIKSKGSLSILPFVTKIISVFIWIIGGIFILGMLGYNVSGIIAGAGIGGIALALAAQKSLTNMFGAITIMLNRPFKIGDVVKIGTFSGKVKDIGLSYLTITDLEGHTVMIPNENIITSSIENLTEREFRKTEFTIGVNSNTTIEKIKQGIIIIENILKNYANRKEIKEKYRVVFDGFGPYSLDIKVTYFSLMNNDIKEYEKQKERINLEIKTAFTEANIELAFPTQEFIVTEKKVANILKRKKKMAETKGI